MIGAEEIVDLLVMLDHSRKRIETIASRFEIAENERREFNAHCTTMRYAVRRLTELARA